MHGHHPPLDWLEKYSLGPRNGDPSCSGSLSHNAPIVEVPIYFLNFSGRCLSDVQAYYSVNPDEWKLHGFDFTFTDGSTETVGQKSSIQEMAAAMSSNFPKHI